MRISDWSTDVCSSDLEGKEAGRASLPKDVPADGLDLQMALKLLSLPREIGAHPETGKPITASIGRYAPYLAHDGKYARLGSTAEVFAPGMKAPVCKLAGGAHSQGLTIMTLGPLTYLWARSTY